MKFHSKIIIICVYCFCLLSHSFASQHYSINNFILKENLIKNSKLAIIACDSTDIPTDKVSGTFTFVINGFKQELYFTNGVAISPQEIDKSSFVFIKHENLQGTHSRLYYVYKSDDGLRPFKISWIALIMVPVIILLIASLYKRLIFIAILALLALAYFNYTKGLSFEGAFETIMHGIKNIL